MSYTSTSRESPEPLPPISMGNAITIAVTLYRSHFNVYLKQSAIAHLWIFVPIYGWAKCIAIMGLISRLAFTELIHQPESVEIAQKKIDRLKCSFFGIFIYVAIGMFLFSLAVVIAISIPLGVVMVSIASQILVFNSASIPATVLIPAIIAIVISVLFIAGALSWCYSRLIIANTPLAVDEETTGRRSVDRGWQLMATASLRIQGMVGELPLALIELPC